MPHRVTPGEDEFFRKEEAERQHLEASAQLQRGLQSAQLEQARLKSAQQRRCPKCRIALEVLTLRGVEIDRCGLCKGIWLDEGELELLCRPASGFIARLMAPLRRITGKSKFG